MKFALALSSLYFAAAELRSLQSVTWDQVRKGNQQQGGGSSGTSKATCPAEVSNHFNERDHYLVGLLNYPNSNVPEKLTGMTTGTQTDTTYPYTPNVGFSDLEFTYDANGKAVLGEYWGLADNGFGSPGNSGDYPLNIHKVSIKKPFTFRHGTSTFERYTPVTNIDVSILKDPNGLIRWENGADIVVTYAVPDPSWEDDSIPSGNLKAQRVLTGRDFDPEGLAVLSNTCAILGDELMPALFGFDPSTGIVKTPFVRTPDINAKTGKFNGMYLSTTGDKVHCPDINDLANCRQVDSSVVESSKYRKVDRSGGFEGLASMPDGSVIGMLEKQSGDTTLQNEPGIRTYKISPGNCTVANPPKFEKFMGFYKPELGGNKISEISPIPGCSNRLVVFERNDFPPFGPQVQNHMWPAPAQPHFQLCIIDTESTDKNLVFNKKVCFFDFIRVNDPYDVDMDGIFKYAYIQLGPEALLVVDDYCFIAGQDTNFPTVNNFGLDESEVPDWEEVNDTRFFVACFYQPIFNPTFPIFD